MWCVVRGRKKCGEFFAGTANLRYLVRRLMGERREMVGKLCRYFFLTIMRQEKRGAREKNTRERWSACLLVHLGMSPRRNSAIGSNEREIRLHVFTRNYSMTKFRDWFGTHSRFVLDVFLTSKSDTRTHGARPKYKNDALPEGRVCTKKKLDACGELSNVRTSSTRCAGKDTSRFQPQLATTYSLLLSYRFPE